MKTQISYYWLLAALALSLLVPFAHGQVVVQHLGANDPEAEGFVLDVPSGAELGPVFDDLGRDAWSIRPRSGNEYGFYESFLTDQERQDAATYGWELSATLRLVNIPDDGGNAVHFFTGTQRFSMEFSTDPDGTLRVRDSRPGGTYRFEEGDSGYHRYTLVYDPLTELARLWIDGVDRGVDFRHRVGETTGFVQFGAGQADTHGHWHEVSLTIIPEPATLALLSGLSALFFVGIVRWRRRKGVCRSGESWC